MDRPTKITLRTVDELFELDTLLDEAIQQKPHGINLEILESIHEQVKEKYKALEVNQSTKGLFRTNKYKVRHRKSPNALPEYDSPESLQSVGLREKAA